MLPQQPIETTLAQAPHEARASAELSHSHTPPGYELDRELARGGMGVIYRARDLRLERVVALKFVLDTLRSDSATHARFVQEAKITGQLEHPGIPPVHELGTLADGRPFLAMKLIHGRTLADLLAEKSIDRSRLLLIFEQICQTLAFVHRRGIIHRDLKPANIMVGEFGEVQVMDWGLAKQIVHEPLVDAKASINETLPFGDDQQRTRFGKAMGTPAYIPPEQARGDVSAMTSRSDVFGLGGILCMILTGHPPFEGQNVRTTVELAAAGRLDEAHNRLDAADVDEELRALAKWCLSPLPADRPSDAGVVAAALATYLTGVAERLKAAEVERAQAIVKSAEMRKRRRIQGILALVLMGSAAVVTFGAWWANRVETQARNEKLVRQSIAQTAVDGLLRQIDDAIRRGRLDEADTLVEQAEQRLRELDLPALTEQLATMRADVRTVRALNTAAENRWTIRSNSQGYAEERTEYRNAFEQAGLKIGVDSPQILGQTIRNSRIIDRLIAGLDEWLEIGPEEPGVVDVLAVADPNPFRTKVRQAIAKRDKPTIQKLAASADANAMTPSFAATFGSVQHLPAAEARKLLLPVYAKHPNNVALAISLGAATIAPQTRAANDEAIGYFRAAHALAPNNVRARLMLSVAHTVRERHDEAIAEAEAAVAAAPKSLRPINALGGAQLRGKRHRDAIATYQRVVNDAHASSRIKAEALSGIGEAFFEMGQYVEAIRHFRQAHELEPTDPTILSYYADSLESDGRISEAMRYFEESIKLPHDSGYIPFRYALALTQRRRFMDAKAPLDQALQSPLAVDGCIAMAIDVAVEQRDFAQAVVLARRERTDYMKENGISSQQYNLERAERLLSLSKMSQDQRDKLLRGDSKDDISVLLHLAEYYRVMGEPHRSVVLYQQFERMAIEFRVPLSWGTLVAASRCAALAARKHPKYRNLTLRWLERLPESLANLHSNAEKGSARNPPRKTILFLLIDQDFADLREPSALAKLPPHERAAWEWVWASLRTVAARRDDEPRELAPPPHAGL